MLSVVGSNSSCAAPAPAIAHKTSHAPITARGRSVLWRTSHASTGLVATPEAIVRLRSLTRWSSLAFGSLRETCARCAPAHPMAFARLRLAARDLRRLAAQLSLQDLARRTLGQALRELDDARIFVRGEPLLAV